MTPDTNKERAEFEAWAVNEGFQIRRLHNPEAGRDYGIDSAQDAWEGWRARAAKAPAAPTGWYALSADGMATLCVDRDDAEKTAADSEKEWPNCGPFRAVQLYTAPLAPTEPWRDIETAPKDGIWQDGNNHYAEYILVWYPGALRPMRARWWFRDDSEACNFLADGGYAVFPTMYQPLPAPPQGAAKGATDAESS